MFGYVKPRAGDLLVREYDFYKAVYCGVCRAMKRETGRLSAMSLSYDIVFLALVRMLYGDRTGISCRRCRCIAHPCRRREMVEGHPALTYAARASALISYYKLKDDVADTSLLRGLPKRIVTPVFSHARRRAALPSADRTVYECIASLSALEHDRVASVDRPADLCGRMLGTVFSAETDCFSSVEGTADAADTLYAVGYELGRFVYAADAADDYDADVRSGSYNPYRILLGDGGLSAEARQDIHTGLMLQLGALERAVLKLPFREADAVEHIIKNIVYEGLPDKIAFLTRTGAEHKTAAPETSQEDKTAAGETTIHGGKRSNE